MHLCVKHGKCCFWIHKWTFQGVWHLAFKLWPHEYKRMEYQLHWRHGKEMVWKCFALLYNSRPQALALASRGDSSHNIIMSKFKFCVTPSNHLRHPAWLAKSVYDLLLKAARPQLSMKWKLLSAISKKKMEKYFRTVTKLHSLLLMALHSTAYKKRSARLRLFNIFVQLHLQTCQHFCIQGWGKQ